MATPYQKRHFSSLANGQEHHPKNNLFCKKASLKRVCMSSLWWSWNYWIREFFGSSIILQQKIRTLMTFNRYRKAQHWPTSLLLTTFWQNFPPWKRFLLFLIIFKPSPFILVPNPFILKKGSIVRFCLSSLWAPD